MTRADTVIAFPAARGTAGAFPVARGTTPSFAAARSAARAGGHIR